MQRDAVIKRSTSAAVNVCVLRPSAVPASNNVALVLAPLNTGISWKWVPGSKWLFNANVNKCFAISQANINDGVSVVTYACNTGTNQLWSLV